MHPRYLCWHTTGANPFTDAKLNVYQSVLYALDDRSRDVSVVFGGAVIAGTRARKQRTMSFNAFASVNFPEIALVRNDRIVRAGPSAPSDGGRCKGVERAARRAWAAVTAACACTTA